MADFEIDMGFNTEGFENISTGGSGKGVDSGISSSNMIGKGFTTALKATGAIALLSNLKIITDLLMGIFSLLNLGVIVFMKTIYEFFKDPARGLLNFGIFLANSFISAIESLIQYLPGGSGVELGRFRTDIIGEELDAGKSLIDALDKGFMTESEYQKDKIAKALLATKVQEDAYIEQLKADRARAELAQTYAEQVNQTLDPAITEGSSAFIKFWNNFIKEVNKMNRKIGGGDVGSALDFAQSRQTGPLSSAQILGASQLRSTKISEQDARAYNYLVGLR